MADDTKKLDIDFKKIIDETMVRRDKRLREELYAEMRKEVGVYGKHADMVICDDVLDSSTLLFEKDLFGGKLRVKKFSFKEYATEEDMDMASTPDDELDEKGRKKIKCLECKTPAFYHRLDLHLGKKHKCTVEEYQARHGGAPVVSEAASAIAAREKRARGPEAMTDEPAEESDADADVVHEEGIFKIGCARLTKRTDLTKEEAAFVPAFDEKWNLGEAEQEELEYLSLGLEAKEPVLIVGPTGCGKSSMGLQLASICNQPMMRMNLHGDVRSADFIGDKTVSVDPESGQSVISFQYGILPKAMRMGAWLMLDELDAAQAHILFVLQAVLEAGVLVLSANYGEVIKAAPGFAIIATANTLGKGDDTGLYTGTNMLNEAFLDRFGVIIKKTYPKPNDEANTLHEKTKLKRDHCAKMVEVATLVRKAAENDSVYCTLGTRKLLHWAAKAVRMGDITRAAKITVLNRLSPDDEKVVSGIIQRVFGTRPY